MLGRRDLAGIGRADRREMRGIDQPRLQERGLAVEFQSVDVECAVRRADPGQGAAIEQSLIGQIVNGQDSRNVRAVPRQVGGDERRLPVVAMDHIRPPGPIQQPRRELGCNRSEAGKPDIVVRPVVLLGVAIRSAIAFVQFRTDHGIDRQPVAGLGEAERAGGKPGACSACCHYLQRRKAAQHLAIARNDHANVAERLQRARQRRRHGGEATDAYEVVHLRRGEKNAHDVHAIPTALCKTRDFINRSSRNRPLRRIRRSELPHAGAALLPRDTLPSFCAARG